MEEKEKKNNINNSLDKGKEQNTIIQIPDNSSEKEDKNDDNNIIFTKNLKTKSDKKIFINDIKEIKSFNYNYLTQSKEEKSSSRNGLIDSSNSIKTNKNINHKLKIKDNMIISPKFKNRYPIENDHISENFNINSIKPIIKEKENEKILNTYLISNKDNEIPDILSLKGKANYENNIEDNVNNHNNINNDNNKNFENALNNNFINNINDNEIKIKTIDNDLVINIDNNENSNEMKIKTIEDGFVRINKKIHRKRNKYDLKDSVKQLRQKKSEPFNRGSYNKKFENLSKCLFCDRISDNEKYNSYFTCGHFFCKKCGKTFYEDIIDGMIAKNNFSSVIQCPIIDCPKIIPLSLLKLIISDEYYLQLLNNINKINDENEVEINPFNDKKKDLTIMKTENASDKKDSDIYATNRNSESHKYLQKNIIDLTSNNKYEYYIKKSFIRCPSCQEYSLYGRIEGNYDKCLKCMKKYCKYCHKVFENSHFDITKENYCKVFYRSYKSFMSQSAWYKYFINLLMVIGGYLFILTFFLLRMKKSTKMRNVCRMLFRMLIFFILFIISLPISIIILPYFPMIISL